MVLTKNSAWSVYEPYDTKRVKLLIL